MLTCPTCSGAKRVTISVVEIGAGTRKESSVEMGCVVCDGAGEISERAEHALAREAAMWCRCGNPSGAVSYHGDGERGSACTKHHWTCDDCSKVTQVG